MGEGWVSIRLVSESVIGEKDSGARGCPRAGESKIIGKPRRHRKRTKTRQVR